MKWGDAASKCAGYDKSEILEKTKTSLLKIKTGQATYERDSVLLEKKEYSWPLIAGLMLANKSQNLEIVDFGGSLGSTYFQCKEFLPDSCMWNVIEQKHYVEAGKSTFENNQLRFYSDLRSILENERKPNVLILSSVLQYIEDYKSLLEELLEYPFQYVILDRTAFINQPSERITIQRVPPEIYDASYPCRFFNENELISIFQNIYNYRIISDFPSFCDNQEITEDGIKLYWKGFLFEKKS